MRGTGKTTIGQSLAKKLKRKLIDTDKVRLKKFKQTAEEAVKKGGWPLFRQQEKEAVKEIAENFDNVIVAVGGGTMMDKDNAVALKKNGKAILLIADTNTMQRRMRKEHLKITNRPALTKYTTPETEIEKIWRQRKNTYLSLADLVIDNSDLTVEEAAKQIVEHFKLKRS